MIGIASSVLPLGTKRFEKFGSPAEYTVLHRRPQNSGRVPVILVSWDNRSLSLIGDLSARRPSEGSLARPPVLLSRLNVQSSPDRAVVGRNGWYQILPGVAAQPRKALINGTNQLARGVGEDLAPDRESDEQPCSLKTA